MVLLHRGHHPQVAREALHRARNELDNPDQRPGPACFDERPAEHLAAATGHTITLRMESTLAHVVLDGVLTRTIALTLTPTQRARLQGARTPGPAPLFDQRPTRVQRTVSCRGGTQIIGQRVQVGLRYAGQIVTIEVDETTLRVYDHREHLIKHVLRTSRKEVTRHKAYGHTTNQKTG